MRQHSEKRSLLVVIIISCRHYQYRRRRRRRRRQSRSKDMLFTADETQRYVSINVRSVFYLGNYEKNCMISSDKFTWFVISWQSRRKLRLHDFFFRNRFNLQSMYFCFVFCLSYKFVRILCSTGVADNHLIVCCVLEFFFFENFSEHVSVIK